MSSKTSLFKFLRFAQEMLPQPHHVIHLASKQPVKIKAVLAVFADEATAELRIWEDAKSGVPAQPFGRSEIRTGAWNRLQGIPMDKNVAVAFESGIILGPKDGEDGKMGFSDITCCLLRTRFGLYERWSKPLMHATSVVQKWLLLPKDTRQETTLGSLYSCSLPCSAHDWYGMVGSAMTREATMTELLRGGLEQYLAVARPLFQAPLVPFRQVAFLDIQEILFKQSRALAACVRRLADHLVFDTVAVLDARGFLLAAEFMRDDYPIVLIRKDGKLPGEALHKTSYQKEYGPPDVFCMAKGLVKSGSRVLVLDDVVATGGSMKAAQVLIQEAGGQVVAFVAPFAVTDDQGKLLGASLGSRLRFFATTTEIVQGQIPGSFPALSVAAEKTKTSKSPVYIIPPSLTSLAPIGASIARVSWEKQFCFSSNLWFDAKIMRNRHVALLLNPAASSRETMDALHLLQILYRKDPSRISVIIPFLETSTQDRVEYEADKGLESLALVDTLAKLVYKNTVSTFDLHAEQSQFAFFDLRNISLIPKLWAMYSQEYPEARLVFPDEGAAKRFGHQLKSAFAPVVFRKKRLAGNQRQVITDDPIEKGGEFVIVDDLIRSGGTIRAVTEFLLAAEAKSVDVLCAHCQLEPAATRNLAKLRQVWTSDSCGRVVPPDWIKIRCLEVFEACEAEN